MVNENHNLLLDRIGGIYYKTVMKVTCFLGTREYHHVDKKGAKC